VSQGHCLGRLDGSSYGGWAGNPGWVGREGDSSFNQVEFSI
jgi:hypothetical protein